MEALRWKMNIAFLVEDDTRHEIFDSFKHRMLRLYTLDVLQQSLAVHDKLRHVVFPVQSNLVYSCVNTDAEDLLLAADVLVICVLDLVRERARRYVTHIRPFLFELSLVLGFLEILQLVQACHLVASHFLFD